jgi:hypothetical protein
VLGNESYLIVEGQPSENSRKWKLAYEPLTINLMGVMEIDFILQDGRWEMLVVLKAGATSLADMRLTKGSSSCVTIVSLKYCVRWEPSDESGEEKPSPDIDIYVEVGDLTTDAAH